jgi:hypothetical protein
VRLTHGGTAEKHGFFRKAISLRKSLSCITSEIRAWSTALGTTGCRDTPERLNASGKTGVSVPYAGLVQFQQSGFPLDDYAKDMPIGEYEVIVDAVCYAKMASRFGTGIHLFARIRETDKKHWFFVHYVPGHASYLRAKELTAGDHARLLLEPVAMAVD